MGACACCMCPRGKRKVEDNISDVRKITIAVLGLDDAGKTATVKVLKGEPSNETVPTIGFTNEEVQFDKHSVKIYDVGGGARIRGIWRNYYADVHGIIYVVDSSQADRLAEARQELKSVLMDERMQGKPCLVLANKQDKSDAVNIELARRELRLDEFFSKQGDSSSHLVGCCAVSGDNTQIKEALLWLIGAIDYQFQQLDERVQKDLKEQRERLEKERAERAERVKKKRQQREEEEAAQRALSGEAETTEEMDIPEGGNPFKPLHLSQFAEERPAVHQQTRQNASVAETAATQLVPPDNRVSLMSTRSLDSAISSTTADDCAATSRSNDDGGARLRTPNTSETDVGGPERPGSSGNVSIKRGTLTPLSHLPPLEPAERLKHKQRRRAKKNQTMPMPANGHAARALSTEHVRPHDPNMADLFGADEVNGRHPHQPQELVRNDGRGDELAAADDLVHAVAAVPKESARNPLVETLGDLESDDNDDSVETDSSRHWQSASATVHYNRAYSTSPPPVASSRLAEFMVDAMTLRPNGDASDVET